MKRISNGHNEAYLKRQAKEIKKQEKISYLKALEKAALNAGFNNWNHFVNSSNIIVEQPLEKVENPPENVIKQNDFDKLKNSNPYRNLLIAGINELLDNNSIFLDHTKKTGKMNGHVFVDLFGFPSVLLWQDVGYDELRISVWWKYNHNKHPQINLTGNARENFNSSSPLANREKYKDFVGVVISGWLERKDGKFIQGKSNNCIFDKYIRKGEKTELEKLPSQKPNGYKSEGGFYV